MTTPPVSDETRALVRSAISDAYYDARNQGRTMEAAADSAVEALAPILVSIDENAHRRGMVELQEQFHREASPSTSGVWREAVNLIDTLVREVTS